MPVSYDDVGRTVTCNYGYGRLERVFTTLGVKVAVIDVHKGGIASIAAKKVQLVEIKGK